MSCQSLCVLALLLFTVIAGCGMRNATAPDLQRTSRRLLYLTQSAGFQHEVLPFSEQVMQDLAGRSQAFEVTVSHDASAITGDSLRQYDAVMFYTTGELPMTDGQKTAFLDWIRSGKGFVGVHSATDTFYKWPEYGDMIGAYFDDHPWHQQVVIRVEESNHPATRSLPKSFTLNEEIYQFRNWSRDRVHVLLSLDPSSVDLTNPKVKRTDKDFALAWWKAYGTGRVFYTALGHERGVWQDERFQQHLLGGIRWAMGDR
jgi:type 1 glutamine amidotransferase